MEVTDNASEIAATQIDVLVDLRSTCQLVLLHPWFQASRGLPDVPCRTPQTKDELEWLIDTLSIVAEVVCLHPVHAESNREKYAAMMAAVVGCLKSTLAESGMRKALAACDVQAIGQELARLRLLVKNSWAAAAPFDQSAA